MSTLKDTARMELKQEILDRLNYLEEVTDEQVLDVIDKVLKTSVHSHHLTLNSRCELRTELFHGIRKLDILEELLEDETITEIMINGERGIFLERNGRMEVITVRASPLL